MKPEFYESVNYGAEKCKSIEELSQYTKSVKKDIEKSIQSLNNGNSFLEKMNSNIEYSGIIDADDNYCRYYYGQVSVSSTAFQ